MAGNVKGAATEVPANRQPTPLFDRPPTLRIRPNSDPWAFFDRSDACPAGPTSTILVQPSWRKSSRQDPGPVVTEQLRRSG